MTISEAFAQLENAATALTGDLSDFIAAILNCPEHGQMRYRPELNLWTCPGWDGEGCPSEWDPEAE